MRLHVNVDHIATIRQARRTDEPDPVRAAVLAELGGADGITVHLREDRRHIQDRDVRLLVETARSGVNFELASAPDIVALALELSPKAVTLVPERREEITTEGGLTLGDVESRQRLGEVVEQLGSAGLPVSLFIDPDRDAIDAAAELGAHAVELHTGEYANACGRTGSADQRNEQVGRLARAAAHAHACGLATHAGHGLTYENVAPIAAIGEIEELNIGHSIVSRAVLTGMESAVREMKRILSAARRGEEVA